MSSFFQELKQRRVVRVAIGYAIAAWLIVQIASTVLPTFHVPEWVLQALIVVVALGFPAALVLAWAFDVTPSGIQKTADGVGETSSRNRRYGWILASVGLVIATIAIGTSWRWHSKTEASSRYAAPQKPVSEETSKSVPDKSIAVLPFDNLSHDPENAYFSEGIQDEILTRLAKITELKVISRTSTQRFKSAPGDLRQIAQQLGVTNVLEGSVQKAGDQVRVNVQLINAITDAHLWAETYDRKLTDIFAVESEIAKTVAETLQAKLTGSAERVLASRPTANPEAHQLYLKGRYFWNKRSGANLQKAIDYFEQAIEKDPGYALAYTGLADAHALVPEYARTPAKEDMPKALAAARKAIELDDSLSEAHTSLANALQADLQLPAAEVEFQKAIALNPRYGTAHQWYGELLEGEGRSDEAVAELKRAVDVDPLSVIINASLGSILSTARRYDEATEQLRRTIEMDPTFFVTHWYLGDLLQDRGALPEAIAEYEKATKLDPDPNVLASLASAYALAGRKEDARKILDNLTKLSQQRYLPVYPLAAIDLALGEKEEALRLLDKSYSDREVDLIASVKIDRRFNALHGDPRFEALVKRVLSGPPQ